MGEKLVDAFLTSVLATFNVSPPEKVGKKPFFFSGRGKDYMCARPYSLASDPNQGVVWRLMCERRKKNASNFLYLVQEKGCCKVLRDTHLIASGKTWQEVLEELQPKKKQACHATVISLLEESLQGAAA